VGDTNPIYRPPKSRRLVSAWMLGREAEHAVEIVTEFQDIFDQVIFMCPHPDPDGSLSDTWPAAERKELARTFRQLGVSTLNDYSGGAEIWVELSKSPKTIRALVGNIVAECEETGADGADIDFEHLPPQQRFAFADFIRQLSDALHARGMMLSICTNAPCRAHRRDGALPFLDLSVIAQYVDHIRPMNYDLFYPSSPVLGPTSTAPWARERMEYLSAQVARHKIIMGLPTYSVDWDITDPTKSRQVYDHQWIAEREKESEIGRAWLSHWDVGLIRYTDAEGHIHLLYVTDGRSTQSHLETADALDLGGICFWVLMGDDPAIWECVRRYFGRR
jgi:spore germination protein YaaH